MPELANLVPVSPPASTTSSFLWLQSLKLKFEADIRIGPIGSSSGPAFSLAAPGAVSKISGGSQDAGRSKTRRLWIAAWRNTVKRVPLVSEFFQAHPGRVIPLNDAALEPPDKRIAAGFQRFERA